MRETEYCFRQEKLNFPTISISFFFHFLYFNRSLNVIIDIKITDILNKDIYKSKAYGINEQTHIERKSGQEREKASRLPAGNLRPRSILLGSIAPLSQGSFCYSSRSIYMRYYWSITKQLRIN